MAPSPRRGQEPGRSRYPEPTGRNRMAQGTNLDRRDGVRVRAGDDAPTSPARLPQPHSKPSISIIDTPSSSLATEPAIWKRTASPLPITSDAYRSPGGEAVGGPRDGDGAPRPPRRGRKTWHPGRRDAGARRGTTAADGTNG
jgi:hypothetical protein